MRAMGGAPMEPTESVGRRRSEARRDGGADGQAGGLGTIGGSIVDLRRRDASQLGRSGIAPRRELLGPWLASTC